MSDIIKFRQIYDCDELKRANKQKEEEKLYHCKVSSIIFEHKFYDMLRRKQSRGKMHGYVCSSVW
jgi:hypothetical protein